MTVSFYFFFVLHAEDARSREEENQEAELDPATRRRAAPRLTADIDALHI